MYYPCTSLGEFIYVQVCLFVFSWFTFIPGIILHIYVSPQLQDCSYLSSESFSVISHSLQSHGVAPWATLSMGFSRQEYWSGLPCPSPGDLPNPGIEFWSPELWADSLPSEPAGENCSLIICNLNPAGVLIWWSSLFVLSFLFLFVNILSLIFLSKSWPWSFFTS